MLKYKLNQDPYLISLDYLDQMMILMEIIPMMTMVLWTNTGMISLEAQSTVDLDLEDLTVEDLTHLEARVTV